MQNGINFEGLNRALLSQARVLLPQWLPEGKIVGHEYVCANLSGREGNSLKVNLFKGCWADFAGTERGGDLISLYAAIHNISQSESARRLAERIRFRLAEQAEQISTTPSRSEPEVIKPPFNTPPPDFIHFRYGKPVGIWCYQNEQAEPLFYVARYNLPNGKEFCPWSWLRHGGWVMKSWPVPRPLFNLAQLAKYPDAAAVITEGEGAAQAAQKLLGKYFVATTWPHGSCAIRVVDWTPLYGRRIVIWADADPPGIKAAYEIAEILRPHCPQIKIVHTMGIIV